MPSDPTSSSSSLPLLPNSNNAVLTILDVNYHAFSESRAADTRNRILLALAFTINFATYSYTLHSFSDRNETRADYSFFMFTCGFSWWVLELYRIVFKRGAFFSRSRFLDNSAELSENEGAGQMPVLAAPVYSSEILGVLFNLTLYLPDHKFRYLQRYRVDEQNYWSEIYMQFGFILFLVGLFIVIQSARRESEVMRSLAIRSNGIDATIVNEANIDGNNNSNTRNNDNNNIPNTDYFDSAVKYLKNSKISAFFSSPYSVIQYPELLGEAILYTGWFLTSLDSDNIWIPVGFILELVYSRISYDEETKVQRYGERNWNAYKNKVQYKLLPGIY